MSDESGSVTPEDTSSESVIKPEDHKRAVKDMLAYKSRARELEAKLAEFEAQKEAAEVERLKAEKKYEDLYGAEKAKRESLEQSLNGLSLKIQNQVKMEAFVAVAGKLAHKDYSNLVDLSKIVVKDDGSVDTASVEAYANSFRQQYPHLLSPGKSSTLPGVAPVGSGSVTSPDLKGKQGADLFNAVRDAGGSLFKKVDTGLIPKI